MIINKYKRKGGISARHCGNAMKKKKIDETMLSRAFKEAYLEEIQRLESDCEESDMPEKNPSPAHLAEEVGAMVARQKSGASKKNHLSRERKSEEKHSAGTIYHGLYKAVAVIVVITVMLGASMAFPQFRSYAGQIFIQVFGDVFRLELEPDPTDYTKIGELTFGYLPRGYSLTESNEYAGQSNFVLENKYGERIYISYCDVRNYDVAYDAETANYKHLTIDGIDVHWIEFENDLRGLVWVYQNTVISIYGKIKDSDIGPLVRYVS